MRVTCYILFTDELCIVELLQMSDFGTGAIRLASFAVNARDFLYPYPSLCPSYVSGSREMLFTRTIAFPVSIAEYLSQAITST